MPSRSASVDGGREHALPGQRRLRSSVFGMICLGCHLTSVRCSGYVYGVVYTVNSRTRTRDRHDRDDQAAAPGAPLARPDDLDRRIAPPTGSPAAGSGSGPRPDAVGDAPDSHRSGARSGQERVAILGYIEDGPNLVTPAMNGWADPEPAWWLNLQANPEATVELPDGTRARSRRAPRSARSARACGRAFVGPRLGRVHRCQRGPAVPRDRARRPRAAGRLTSMPAGRFKGRRRPGSPRGPSPRSGRCGRRRPPSRSPSRSPGSASHLSCFTTSPAFDPSSPTSKPNGAVFSIAS